jgi:2'-5' RNA ligase
MKTENLSTLPLMREAYDQERYEYLLVANPDKDVHEKIMAEKQVFYEEYKETVSIQTKPHITVANFLADEVMEDTIIRWMQRIFTKQQSFTVTLNNYSGFPPHTIYLRVQNATPFQQLAKELKVVNSYISSCSCPPMKPISNPHISIAGKLPEEVYFRALTQYSHKSFHESFMVKELLLLKRKHQYDTCKTINVFALQLSDTELAD